MFFSANPLIYIDQVKAIKITVTRTFNSTSPCLGLLEIYGLPINSSHKPDSNTTFQSEIVLQSPQKIEIPIEFLDELTFDLMRMPMILPSKKRIDKSTLDTYLEELKRNKQTEKDPFTQKEFSSGSQPVIDESLKAKIDRFLLDTQNSGMVLKTGVSSKQIKPLHTVVSECFNNGDPMKLKSMSTKRNLPSSDRENNTDRKRSKIEIEIKKLNCACCLNEKNESKCLYEILTCGHRFCRPCIIVLDKICSVCKKRFEFGQVINSDRNFLSDLHV